MSDLIIQGNWDDLIARQDLRGRKVIVTIIDEKMIDGLNGNIWLNRLRAWAESHKPLENSVDDSREAIYSASVDDPR